MGILLLLCLLASHKGQRNMNQGVGKRWRNQRIPYAYNGDFNAEEKEVIQKAFTEISSKTCIQFVERTHENDYIEFGRLFAGNRRFCATYMGRMEGKKLVVLGKDCLKTQIRRVLMMTLGFYPEHQRLDRDNYVRINYRNVANSGSYFAKVDSFDIKSLGPYDMKSVLQYPENYMSNNGISKTIEAVDGTELLGNTESFSQGDFMKINRVYECKTEKNCATKNKTPTTTKAPTTTTKAPTTTTKAPTTTTKAPTTKAPTTKAPTTKAPTTKAPTTTTKAPSPSSLTGGSCSDEANWCQWYALHNACVEQYWQMKDRCPSSCLAYLEDTDKRCARFVQKGYCEKTYQNWMADNCAKSCLKC